jgi:ribosomal protein S6
MAAEAKKQYEISFLLREGSSADPLVELLKKSGGEIVGEVKLTEMKLAYPIDRQISALFGCLVFSAMPEEVVELNKKMPFVKEVLRFLIVTPPIAKTVRRSFGDNRPSRTATENKAEPVNEEKPAEEKVNDTELDKKLEEILS